MKSYHDPVLLRQSVEGLAIEEDGVYVDVTFGGGGHSKEILSRLGEKGRLYAFDQDADAARNVIDDDRLVLIPQNFRYIQRYLRFYGVKQVNGVLADFGVSSHQFDAPDRGFSTRFNGPLDMRMNQDAVKSAAEVVNEYSQQSLRKMFIEYADLRNANALANAIVLARNEEAIQTTDDLKRVLERFLPKHKENKILAQIYQAIRIEVNEELEVIKELLLQLEGVLCSGGRVSVISYHSLEDRLVKRFFRSGNFEGKLEKDFYGNVVAPFKAIGKLVVPTKEEIGVNNRARSAKLRIAEKK